MLAHRRRVLALAASAVLVAMSTLSSASVFAAVPTVSLGSSSPDTISSGAVPSVVSTGDVAIFTSSLRNDDQSTLAQLYMSGASDGSVYAIEAVVNGSASSACDAATFSCSWKGIKPGDVVSITVAITAPATVASANCGVGFSQGYGSVPSGSLSGDCLPVVFTWSTTGSTPSDGGTSHGDIWQWWDAASLNADATNFRSRYVWDSSLLLVSNDQNVGPDNRQATFVASPNAKIPVTIQDGPGAIGSCDGSTVGLDCSTGLFGEWSLVDVDGGTTFGTAFKIVITMDSSEIPHGVTARNLVIYHSWDGGEELIADSCSKSNPASTAPCRTVEKLKGGDFVVTIWTLHNGGFKGTLG